VDITLDARIAYLDAELSAAGHGLAGNADVLRSVLAGCGDCIKILDLDGRLQFMSEGGKRVMEVEDFSRLKGCPWPDFWADAGNVHARAAIAAARAGETYRFTGAAGTAKATPRHWDVQVSPIMGPDAVPAYILSISRDITAEWQALADLKQANERQTLLALELQHRIKNTLAMVGAIANQTMRGDDVEAARSAFTARLMTLSSAHDILTRSSFTAAPLRDVVEGAIAPHRTTQDRIHIDGPAVDLQPKHALALSLALHELATNAVKYGALSNAAGTVEIDWALDDRLGEPSFAFRWRERNGPPVVEPDAAQRGFGTKLIERILASEFHTTAAIDFAPTGVTFAMDVPVASMREELPG
jgi:two-component sensor histidine kinase